MFQTLCYRRLIYHHLSRIAVTFAKVRVGNGERRPENWASVA
jgi:hypothetical protein